MTESLEKHFCYYCGDTQVCKDWERIGGNFEGERHYLCHRKRCAKKHEAFVRWYREKRVAKKAAIKKIDTGG